MTNEISQSYGKALELHNKILVSAQLAQANLWEMCAGLKEMRDGKLYKELGYQNFEDYCGKEFNMSRRNAYRYISVIENCSKENVTSMSHFGATKLYLLSTLSESEQEKLAAENDVESMTVKKLEKEVKKLKNEKLDLEKELDGYAKHITGQDDYIAQLKGKVIREEEEAAKIISDLKKQVKDLEARPVEVAVAEPSEDVRQLKLAIKNLERTTEKQLASVQEEHIAAERRLRQDHAKELEIKLGDQARYYEGKLAEAQSETADDKQAFKAYFAAAYDAFNRMLEFAKASPNKEFFKEKISNQIRANVTDCVLFRVNAGDFWQGEVVYSKEFRQRVLINIRRIEGLPEGFSDLFGVRLLDGKAVFIEVKTKTGRPAEKQRNFIRKMRSYGAVAGICRSVKEAVELIGSGHTAKK